MEKGAENARKVDGATSLCAECVMKETQNEDRPRDSGRRESHVYALMSHLCYSVRFGNTGCHMDNYYAVAMEWIKRKTLP